MYICVYIYIYDIVHSLYTLYSILHTLCQYSMHDRCSFASASGELPRNSMCICIYIYIYIYTHSFLNRNKHIYYVHFLCLVFYENSMCIYIYTYTHREREREREREIERDVHTYLCVYAYITTEQSP